MMSFLEMLDKRWGGAKGYVKEELALADENIELIRENLAGS